MLKNITKLALPLVLFLCFGVAHADDTLFSTHLFAKFQAKACTICHDFYEQNKGGLAFNSHAKRLNVNNCKKCHSEKVTGFDHVGDWFAQPGLYTSGMNAKETCEATKKAFHAEFKSDELLSSQMINHLLNDPRVLWGIEGATSESGQLPFKKQEAGLVKGGLDEWNAQVMAWVNGGMKCE